MKRLAAILVLLASQAWATTYYVSSTDTSAAAHTVLSNAASGDVVWFPAKSSGFWSMPTISRGDAFSAAAWYVKTNVSVLCSNGAVFSGGDTNYRVVFLETGAVLSNAVVVCGRTAGGAAYDAGSGVNGRTNCDVWNSVITGCVAATYGAVANLRLWNSHVSSNSAAYSAVYVQASNSVFYGNTNGSAAAFSGLSRCSVLYNRGLSTVPGGAFTCTNSGSLIAYNVGSGAGGAGVRGGFSYNCAIVCNTNTGDVGAGVYLGSAYGCTIVSNRTLSATGGGVYNTAGGGTISNSIVFGNFAASPTTFFASNFYVNTPIGGIFSTGLVATSPIPFEANFNLPAGHPAIDSANGTHAYVSSYPYDVNGGARVYGTNLDYGAAEWQQPAPSGLPGEKKLFLMFGGQ